MQISVVQKREAWGVVKQIVMERCKIGQRLITRDGQSGLLCREKWSGRFKRTEQVRSEISIFQSSTISSPLKKTSLRVRLDERGAGYLGVKSPLWNIENSLCIFLQWTVQMCLFSVQAWEPSKPNFLINFTIYWGSLAYAVSWEVYKQTELQNIHLKGV